MSYLDDVISQYRQSRDVQPGSIDFLQQIAASDAANKLRQQSTAGGIQSVLSKTSPYLTPSYTPGSISTQFKTPVEMQNLGTWQGIGKAARSNVKDLMLGLGLIQKAGEITPEQYLQNPSAYQGFQFTGKSRYLAPSDTSLGTTLATGLIQSLPLGASMRGGEISKAEYQKNPSQYQGWVPVGGGEFYAQPNFSKKQQAAQVFSSAVNLATLAKTPFVGLAKTTLGRMGIAATDQAIANTAMGMANRYAQSNSIDQAFDPHAITQDAVSGAVLGGGFQGVSSLAKKAIPSPITPTAISKPLTATEKIVTGKELPQAMPKPVLGNIVKGEVKVSQPIKFNEADVVKTMNQIPRQELERAQALGLSPRQVAEIKLEQNGLYLNATDTALAKNIQAKGITVAEKGPKTTAAVQKAEAGIKSWQENTNANPVKSNLGTVQPGEYYKARVLPQQASVPVRVAAIQAADAVKKLTKTEQANFWKMVENPSLAKSVAAKEAIAKWKYTSDLVHANSQALGGNTNYLKNYDFRNIDLTDNKTLDALKRINNGHAVDPQDFKGIDTLSRKFATRAEAEAAGIKFKNPGNPAADILDYGSSRASQLHRAALIRGAVEADFGNMKNRVIDMGRGNSLQLSDEAYKQLKSFVRVPKSDNAFWKIYDKANSEAKGALLSLSQFHTINISGLRAAPTLMFKGHPVAAAKGLYGSFRAAFGTKYIDKIMQEAQDSGIIEKSAQLGTPILGQTDIGAGGFVGRKLAFGEKTVFEKQIPAMHYQMVKSLVSDLEKRGISLSSKEAQDAGIAVNKIMGFINTEVQNLSPAVQKNLSRVFLAPQFTRSKWSLVKDAAKGGQAGSYARRAIIGNIAATTGLIAGISSALYAIQGEQQKQSIQDAVLKAIFDPTVSTPMKDAKGRNIALRLPASYTSEIAKVMGMQLKTNKDGHQYVNWDISQMPQALVDYARARLAIIPADALKIWTNTNYAGKPLYDANAPFGTKVIQGATTLLQGNLPISAQGILQTGLVKNLLPGTSKQIIEANQPGTNPLIKSIAAGFGATPITDVTQGKGLENKRFFDEVNKLKNGLNQDGKNAVDAYFGSKINPVTGQYDIQPTVWDTINKAVALLKAEKSVKPGSKSAIDNIIEMNKNLADKGQTVDPLWLQPKDKIISYLEYQSNPDPKSAQRQVWYNNNKNWYAPLAKDRSNFYNSLPPGNPNKPAQPIEYPQASPAVQKLMDTYFNMDNPKDKIDFLKRFPELQKQFDAQFKYNNDLLSARGYQPYKDFPKASPELQQFIDKYTASDTGTKKAMRNSDPQSYIAMSNYFDNMNLYEINKQGALSILQGQPDYTNKELKQISNLARDIVIQNGLSTLVPAAFMQGYGTSGKGKKMSSAMKFQRRKLNQMLKKATLKKISSGKIKKTNLSSVLSGSKFLTTPKTSKGANSSLSSLL